MKHIDRIIEKTIMATSLLAFWILFALVFYTVMARLFELSSIAWMDDINNLCIVWMVFMGSVLCLRNGEHVTTDFIKNILDKRLPRAARVLDVANHCLILFFLLYLLHASWLLVTEILTTAWLPSLPIVKSWWMSPILLSCALMVYYTVVRIANALRGKGA